MAPPWREIFEMDRDRRFDFDTALAEYSDIVERLPGWGYRCHIIPRESPSERADGVIGLLGESAIR